MVDDAFIRDVEGIITRAIEERVVKASGEALLRHALAKLTVVEPGDMFYNAIVYQALMGASDMGIPCGVRGTVAHEDIEGIYAVIRLPDGTVTFRLDNANHLGGIADERGQAQAIESFLSSTPTQEEVADTTSPDESTPTDSPQECRMRTDGVCVFRDSLADADDN